MDSILVCRSAIFKAFPKTGRKIWRSLLLDLIFVKLGVKKSLLFDYADTTASELNALLSNLTIKLDDHGPMPQCLAKELLAIQVGKDIFIIHNRFFSDHVTTSIDNYLGENEANNETSFGIIIDVSSSKGKPCKLKDNEEIKNTKIALWSVLNKLHLRKSHCFPDNQLLEEDYNICMCTIYGIFLNYPVVYWLNTESNNLSNGLLHNYQLKIKGKNLFGIDVPDRYCITSFTVPESIDTEKKQDILLWWEKIKETLNLNSFMEGEWCCLEISSVVVDSVSL